MAADAVIYIYRPYHHTIIHIMIINFEGTLLFHDLDFMFQINNTVYSLNKNYTYTVRVIKSQGYKLHIFL